MQTQPTQLGTDQALIVWLVSRWGTDFNKIYCDFSYFSMKTYVVGTR